MPCGAQLEIQSEHICRPVVLYDGLSDRASRGAVVFRPILMPLICIAGTTCRSKSYFAVNFGREGSCGPLIVVVLKGACACLESYFAVTVKLLRIYCAITVQLLCDCCAVTVHLLCGYCAITLQFLCDCCAVAVQLLCSYFVVTVRLLCSYCAVTLQLLCDYCAVTVRLLCSYCAALNLVRAVRGLHCSGA